MHVKIPMHTTEYGNYLSKQSVSVADRATPRALSNDAHLWQIINMTTQVCKQEQLNTQ